MLMRRLGGAATLLVLGLAVPARAADEGAKSGGDSFWSWLNPFSGKKKTDDAPTVPPTVPVPGAAATVPAAAVAQPAVGDPSRAKEDYDRRLAVIDRLMQIALDTNNTQLERQLELLEMRVWEVYKQRTGINGGAKFAADEAFRQPGMGGGSTNAREDRR